MTRAICFQDQEERTKDSLGSPYSLVYQNRAYHVLFLVRSMSGKGEEPMKEKVLSVFNMDEKLPAFF